MGGRLDAIKAFLRGRKVVTHGGDLGDLAKISDAGNLGEIKKGWRVYDDGGKQVSSVNQHGYYPWKAGSELRYIGRGGGRTGSHILQKAFDLAPSSRGILRSSALISAVAVIGFATLQAISVIGSLSESWQKGIDNFYGLNCSDKCSDPQITDYESCLNDCEARGARNLAYTGLIVGGVLLGITFLAFRPAKRVVRV